MIPFDHRRTVRNYFSLRTEMQHGRPRSDPEQIRPRIDQIQNRDAALETPIRSDQKKEKKRLNVNVELIRPRTARLLEMQG